MKRILLLLVILSALLISTSCGRTTVEINAENFNEYFAIETVTNDVNVIKHGGGSVLGINIPVYYSADATFTLKIYPKKTMDIDSVKAKINVFDAAYYFDIDETTTVDLPANGESYTKQFKTSTKDDFFDEHFFDGIRFVFKVKEASGKITVN